MDPKIVYDTKLITPPSNIDPPKPPEPIIKEKIAAYRPPVVTVEKVNEYIDLNALMEGEKNGTATEPPDDGNLNGSEPKKEVVIDQVPDEKPVPYTDFMPSFFGGEEAMYKWIGEIIKYPLQAKETGVKGTVIVTFVVEKDGSITDAKLLKDIGGGCGAEAMRVVSLMPKWREGRQSNKPVRVQFVLPIKFELE